MFLLVDPKHSWSCLTSGSDYNCVVVTDGKVSTLWCWGDNNSQKLGLVEFKVALFEKPVLVSCFSFSVSVDFCMFQCLFNTCVDDGCGGTCLCSEGFGCIGDVCMETIG